MGRSYPAIDQIRALYAQDRVIFALLVLYSVIFAGFFFLPTDAHRDIFYLTLPLTLYAAFKNSDFLKAFFADHKFQILIVLFYIFYMSLTLLWSHTTEEGREFDKAKILLFLPLSIMGLFLTVKKAEPAYTWLVYSFVTSAFLSGLYLLAAHLAHNLESESLSRLEGLGRAGNSVMAGYLYAMAFLAVLYAKPFYRMAWKYRIVIGGIALMIMLCSLSRGPLLALAITMGVMMLVNRHYKLILASVVVFAVAATIIFTAGLRDDIPIINRADTGRPQVWAQSVDHILEKPIFGYGVGSKFTYDYILPGGRIEQTSHPHSFYLGTMIQGGALSLVLLLGIMGIVGMGALRTYRATSDGWPLAVFVSFATLGLYDFGGVYVNLGVVWIAFWFQYALIMAREKPDPVV